METLRNINFKFAALLVVVGLLGCKTTKQETAQTIPDKAIQVKVIDYSELDGCKFLLETSDGKKLQPTNLPEKFSKDGIRLAVTYKVKDGMSICMAGTMVELILVSEVK
ncbi:MAG TPA: hypothetical protein PKD91_16760 [Bacteroidia bacterium]|nr:hypothetical protein [Bacteroidia bacterium]